MEVAKVGVAKVNFFIFFKFDLQVRSFYQIFLT